MQYCMSLSFIAASKVTVLLNLLPASLPSLEDQATIGLLKRLTPFLWITFCIIHPVRSFLLPGGSGTVLPLKFSQLFLDLDSFKLGVSRRLPYSGTWLRFGMNLLSFLWEAALNPFIAYQNANSFVKNSHFDFISHFFATVAALVIKSVMMKDSVEVNITFDWIFVISRQGGITLISDARQWNG